MAVRGVIFDMGGTLLDYHPPGAAPNQGWRAMEDSGADAFHAWLAAQGVALPALGAARAISFAIVERHWRGVAEQSGANPRLEDILREVAAAWGAPAGMLADGQMDRALAAYVAPAQGFVRPLAGARETLAALQTRGLRLGLVSNTVWPGEVHRRDLARHGLLPYLEAQFFSADVAAWKPDARIFQMALDALDLQPEEAVYVGDHLYFDVWGAQRAGLRGVWIWSAEWDSPRRAGLDVHPDATLRRLPELLDVIRAWVA